MTRGGRTLFEASWGYADRAARDAEHPGDPVRAGVADQDVHRRRGRRPRPRWPAGLRDAGRRRPARAPSPEHARRGGDGAPPALPHLGDRRLRRGGRGLPGYLEDYAALWIDRPSYAIERPADFLPLFADLPPYRPPGQEFQYSNAGYILLGLVIEQVAGTSYAEAVQARVFDPAGMTASGFFRLDEAVPDVATGYLPRTSPDSPRRTNIYSIPVVGGADGGAMSTTGDLDRFLRAYADGTLLGDLTDVMLRPHADASTGSSRATACTSTPTAAGATAAATRASR